MKRFVRSSKVAPTSSVSSVGRDAKGNSRRISQNDSKLQRALKIIKGMNGPDTPNPVDGKIVNNQIVLNFKDGTTVKIQERDLQSSGWQMKIWHIMCE